MTKKKKMERKIKKPEKKKICFLITPIGQADSTTRIRVDQWKELIYEPALGTEYEIIRADMISTPGIITEQVIQHIIDAELVIIDYTELNSNVMYEAAIRHLSGKPYIQIHESGVHFPFDIHNLRSISYSKVDLRYPEKLVKNIKKNLKEINNPKYKQPQVIKEKFDFNKILEDPEKFVNLLKKYIVTPSSHKTVFGDGIVAVSDSSLDLFDPMYSSGQIVNRKKIVCPKCKTIKYETGYDDLNPFLINAGSANIYTNSFLGNHHYKCNNCGTEFER